MQRSRDWEELSPNSYTCIIDAAFMAQRTLQKKKNNYKSQNILKTASKQPHINKI